MTPIRNLPHHDTIRNNPILIVGDLMLDEYHWCDVARISPEAPVPICSIHTTTLMPGGAGNVAHNLSELNGIPHLIGTIGDDSSGEKLMKTLQSSGIKTEYIHVSDDRPTILKSRVIAHHQHVIRLDRDSPKTIKRSTHQAIINQAKELIPDMKAVLLSDYGKGTLSENVIQKIIAMSHEHSIPVIVDPKGTDYRKYKHATLLTPNFNEFCLASRSQPTSETMIHQKAIQLKNRLHLAGLLITRSEKGMSFINEENEKMDIETRAREVYDITGAGDTVIATLTLCLSAGWPMETACQFANYAAGIVVAKVGTSTTTISEIMEIIKGDN